MATQILLQAFLRSKSQLAQIHAWRHQFSPNLNSSQAYTKWNGFSNHRVIALHALQSANVHVKTHYHERLTVVPSNLSLLQHVPSSKVVKTAAGLNGSVPTLVAAAITTL